MVAATASGSGQGTLTAGMNSKWRELDLGGGGLQAANLRLARTLRRRPVAYGLMLGFPLGLHRWYLGEHRSALLFPVLTAAAIAGGLTGMTAAAVAALLALAALLGYDLYTMERRIAAYNKRQRMAVYLSQGAGAPAGYRGRFAAGADTTAATRVRTASRVPSLAEQEALLREITARKPPAARPPQ